MNDGLPKQDIALAIEISKDREAARCRQEMSYRQECRLIHPQGSEKGTCSCEGPIECYCPIDILRRYIQNPELHLDDKRKRRIARMNKTGWTV